MFLVSKYEEIQPYSISEFAHVSADSCTVEQIRDMEKKILLEVDYQFGKPFSLQFLRRYSKIQNATVFQHNMAKYILEQSLLDSSLSSIKPSLKAAAALQLSLQLLDNCSKPSYDYWNDTLSHYTGYKEVELIRARHQLRGCLACYHTSDKFTAVRKKYQKDIIFKNRLP